MLATLASPFSVTRTGCLEDTHLTNSTMRGRLMASSMISGVALAAMSATGAYAQAAPPAPAAAPADQATAVTEFVVTGSRIPQPNLTSTSPITMVGSQEVKLQGSVRAEDLLNNLPQVFAGQGSQISNGSTGTATVDLRGLGPSRTLVLIDGRRVMPGDPFQPTTDLNFIPEQLVDRVEVLTGGASAVYGSDAVSGVVNFIMLKNFEGIRLDAQISGYQHDNGNDFVQGLNTARGYTAPTGSTWDGRQANLSAILGVSSPDGKGNIETYFTYRNIQPIFQSARDYSNCALQETATSFKCRGSLTNNPATIISNDLAVQSKSYLFTVDPATGNTLKGLTTEAFNFAPYNYFQRPDEQYSAGAYAHYELNPHADAYMQLMFMDDHTLAQIAPSGIFGQTFNIGCTSPLLSAQEISTLCTDAGLGPNDQASVAILRRNTEGGPRVANLRHTDYRVVLGVKGEINSDWSYDAYGQIGRSVFAQEYLHEFSLSKTAKALDVVTDENGNLICRSVQNGTDPTCVPYLGAFSTTPPSAASLAYIQANGFQEGATTEMVASAAITGHISQLKSPWAEDSVGVAFGGEYRQEQLDLRVDQEFETGDLAGQGGPTPSVSGSYQVYEGFGEIRVPIIQNAPFVKALSFEGGYRYSHYNLAGETNTYKVAGEWAPTEDIRFRAGFNRAVRAPNILELFTPQAVGLGLNHDPCAGPATQEGFPTEAQCANSGVSAAQYGHIAVNPAGQYNALFGGNLNLKPEVAKTFTIGGVITPRMLPGFSLSVDYFRIKVDQYIQAGIAPDITLDQCVFQATPASCALVHRAPGTGSLWLGTNGFVDATSVNVGFLKTDGIDFSAAYRLPLSNLGWENGGSLSFDYQATYLLDLITSPGVSAFNDANKEFTQYDCAGLFGQTACGTPAPVYRHNFRITWRTPVQGLEVSGRWRYIGSVDALAKSDNPFINDPTILFPIDEHIGAQSYFDLSGQWRLKDKVTFRAGVQNIADKEPPLVGSLVGGATNPSFNANTYPQTYDAIGRYVFVGATVDF
ncbi:MAG: TonB-dependent receptor [Caulobacteraceae bacterium]|nr:TonB-dependent receptor [Caulobacteraceae bacterium]